MRFEFPEKPEKCPVCGSVQIADILYGLPLFTPALKKEMDAGQVILGGCVIHSEDPKWQCTVCQTKFFRKA